MKSEIDKACEIAWNMGARDVNMAIRLGEHFGLRINEIVTVRIHQLENAWNYRQFHVPNGKGGQTRDIPAYQMESLARVLLPVLQKYLSSDGADGIMKNGKQKSVNRKKTVLSESRLSG